MLRKAMSTDEPYLTDRMFITKFVFSTYYKPDKTDVPIDLYRSITSTTSNWQVDIIATVGTRPGEIESLNLLVIKFNKAEDCTAFTLKYSNLYHFEDNQNWQYIN